jgi:putative endonuclease
MSYFMYVLKSRKDGSLFKGITRDVGVRLKHHNAGKHIKTKQKIPLEVVYIELHATYAEALKRKTFFSSETGTIVLQRLLNK